MVLHHIGNHEGMQDKDEDPPTWKRTTMELHGWNNGKEGNRSSSLGRKTLKIRGRVLSSKEGMMRDHFHYHPQPQDSRSNPLQGGEDDGGPSLAKSSKTPTHAKQDVQMTWLRSKRTKPG